MNKFEMRVSEDFVFAEVLNTLAQLTTSSGLHRLYQKNRKTLTWTQAESHSHAYRCIVVIVLFLQVDVWHLTSQQCPAELPADLQFIKGSYLSHSFSLFIHYSFHHSSFCPTEVVYCPLVELIRHVTKSTNSALQIFQLILNQ